MWQVLSSKLAHVIVALLNVLAPLGSNIRQNVVYAPGASHQADIYRPGGGAARPVVVFLYGGGWRSGSKEDVAFVGAALARRGFVVVIPEYRHVPMVGLPDILADNAAAVAWTIAHASEFGGDPHRVVVAGHSSGAWAAAMLALDPRWLAQAGVEPSALAGMIGIAGPYAVWSLTEPEDKEVFAGSGPEMEPINLRPSRQPPLLLVAGTADRDVLPSSTSALADHVRGLGGRVESHIYAGLGHDQIVKALSFPFSLWSPVSSDVDRFLHLDKRT